jgi:hypothetical protein
MPNNKISSEKQEHLVAEYLGCKVVSGSGARPFNQGDVTGYSFLIECKTHNTEQQNIIFYKKHWIKISEEAIAHGRFPALVVDNGTQSIKNTWVMIPKRILADNSVFRIFGLTNTSRTDSTITFKNTLAMTLYQSGRSEDRVNYFPEWCNREQVAIMPLSEFKELYIKEFGA